MRKYLVVVEETETGFSAFSPDLDGCIATGTTREEVETLIKEAMQFHLEGMKEDGLLTPVPHSYSIYCELA
ncbi:type II toxin-antitoxin system HicB family antitoxin [Desulfobacter sp.]|uniref:type II toxin-antitoxin system HicB family antitoxin n=1 Tax=Desulfobacter sp. TaxID=2294 RepID=UPI003D0CD45E